MMETQFCGIMYTQFGAFGQNVDTVWILWYAVDTVWSFAERC